MLSFLSVILFCIVLYGLFRKVTPKVTPKVTWLATQTASAGTSTSTTLTLNTKEDVFMFSDRPNRLFNLERLLELVTRWDKKSTFNNDHPNAVITWKNGDGKMAFAEIILTNAKMNTNGFIEYMYVLETGNPLTPELSNVSLFIDNFWGCDGDGDYPCYGENDYDSRCNTGLWAHEVDVVGMDLGTENDVAWTSALSRCTPHSDISEYIKDPKYNSPPSAANNFTHRYSWKCLTGCL